MRPLCLSKRILFLSGVFLLLPLSASPLSIVQASGVDDGLTPSEKEAVEKASDPDQQLKLYLEVANNRLKTIVSSSHKGQIEETAQAVTGFRTAVGAAEESIAKAQAAGKNRKKAMTNLLRATEKYNSSLLLALEKAPEDLRQYIQSAHEVSLRVHNGVTLQLERMERKK